MPLNIVHNPFATRFTQPGVRPFVLRHGERLESIAESFRENNFLCQIVGPHGGGKTTLTHALEPHLRDHFHWIRRVSVRNPNHVLSDDVNNPVGSSTNRQLLVLDGLERLPWLHRRLLLQHARQPQFGMLLTTHRPLAGIPILYEVRPTVDTLRQLTDELAPGIAIDQRILEIEFANNNGNIRESLMALYDWFESRKSTATTSD